MQVNVQEQWAVTPLSNPSVALTLPVDDASSAAIHELADFAESAAPLLLLTLLAEISGDDWPEFRHLTLMLRELQMAARSKPRGAAISVSMIRRLREMASIVHGSNSPPAAG